MNSLLRKFRQHQAAGAAEYALLVGLITLGAIGAVAATGTQIRDLFGEAESRVAIIDENGGDDPAGEDPGEGGPGGNGGPLPVVTASFGSSAPYGGEAFLTYDVTDADSLSATWAFTGGACAARTAEGDAPQPLSLAGFAGVQGFLWSEERSGCSVTVHLEASNANGMAPADATFAYDLRDTAPDGVAFADVGPQEPGDTDVNTVESPLEIVGIDGAVDAQILTDGPYFLSVLSDDTWSSWSKSATVSEGDSLALKATAPLALGTETLVDVQIGSVTATWSFWTRGADDQPEIGEIYAVLAAPASQVVESDAFQVTDFETPLVATASVAGAPSVEISVLEDGVWSAYAATQTVNPGQYLRLRTTAGANTGDEVVATININGVARNWSVTTGVSPYALIDFGTKTVSDGNTYSTTLRSLPYPPATLQLSLRVVDGEASQYNFAWITGSLAPGTDAQILQSDAPAPYYGGNTFALYGAATDAQIGCRTIVLYADNYPLAKWRFCRN